MLFGSLVIGLPKLRELHLYRNLLIGTLPELTKPSFASGGGRKTPVLSELKVVWLFENRFSGQIPPEFCIGLTAVCDLRLNSNNVSGMIPDELGTSCPNLKTLHLQRNQLTGTIDPIFNCYKLSDLRLWHNKLSGTIEDGIGNLRNLEVCLLHKNRFERALPSGLRRCAKLVDLDLSRNNFKGDVNGAIFGGLRSLKTLSLAHNPKITGRAPREIATLRELTRLDLTSTGLLGLKDLAGAVALSCPSARVSV